MLEARFPRIHPLGNPVISPEVAAIDAQATKDKGKDKGGKELPKESLVKRSWNAGRGVTSAPAGIP